MGKKIVIRRVRTVRYYGVAEAAKRLGVSVQAVSNYVSGRYRGAISKDKADRIAFVDSGAEVKK